MLTHGYPKLMNFSSMKDSFPDPLHIGSTLSLAGTIGAEFFCALLVLLGIATRLAAVPVVFAMSVAVFIVHASDGLQKKELGILYGLMYLALAFMGGGAFSLGNKFPKLKKYS